METNQQGKVCQQEELNHVKYVIHSLSEGGMAGNIGLFWSNKDGWGALETATRFTTHERMERFLPVSKGGDSEWMLTDEALDLTRKVPTTGKIWHNADNQAEAEQWKVDLLAKGATLVELKPETDRSIVSVIITLDRSRANEILGYEVAEEEWLDVSDDEQGKVVVRSSVGAVVPGSPYVVGGGQPSSVALSREVDRAAELLRNRYGIDVEKRYNSNGRSGGAFLVTDGEAHGIGTNGSVGISVGIRADGLLRVNVMLAEQYLLNPALATCGGVTKYAYPSVESVGDALSWLDSTAVIPLRRPHRKVHPSGCK